MVTKSSLYAGIEDAYPLSRLQAGMLFHSAYSPETNVAIYHDIFSYHLKAIFDLSVLQTAAQQLAARHPVLRTSFNLDNFDRPLQLVHRIVDIPIQVEDMCSLAHGEQEATLDAWMEAEKNRPFDWTQPPLLRFQVHRRTEETFQFTVSFHHAILDGWSVASMLTELFQIYLSVLGKDVPTIRLPPTVTFRDFIALEQKAIESEEHRRYWTEKLEDCAIVAIPRWSTARRTDSLRQVLRHGVSLSDELSIDLKRLAQSAGIPLKSILLAAHLWVLSQLSGQSDVLTGLVSNGRLEETDGERTIGLFLNTLPFRLKLSGGTWMNLIKETYRVEQEMLPFRRYPLAEMQRLRGGQPLFEIAFNYIHFHVYQSLSEFTDIQSLGGKAYEETNFALATNFSQDLYSSQINLTLMYDNTVFCTEQVKAIGEHYLRSLTAVATNPMEHHTACSLLSEAERCQMLVEWNTTQSPYPLDKCPNEIFEMQVQRTPGATAVVFKDQRLTYSELNERANQLAHHLQSLGVGPEVRVGICMERSPEMIVAILASIKAGGAYVPIDPTYPLERLAFTLADTQAPVLLTQQKFVAHPAFPDVTVIYLDAATIEELTIHSIENPISNVTLENLAYVIYTSGSTGRPKGVAVQQGELLNLIAWHQRVYEITAADRATLIASPAFDASVWELWPYLTVGASVYIPDDNTRATPASLVSWLAGQAITITFLPTPLAEAVLEQPWPDELALRTLLTGGDKLHRRPGAEKPFTLVNNYGPTENTVVTTWTPVLADAEAGAPPPIGRPIDNTQVYLLNDYGQPVPIGVPGELYIGGNSLARGYLNRPELTAEKFIPNPFNDEPGTRLYKSGDLARYLPDRNIEFLGRRDHQVKVRGFRVELAEIEAVLLQHPAVSEAVTVIHQIELVAGIDDSLAPSRLVAYIVPGQNQSPKISELRHFLQAKLPDYMTPAVFIMLDALPLTPSGKVDRRALPAPDTARPQLEKTFVAPRTPIEENLVAIWQEVLNLESVGIQDNFIELGGDSILGLQIAARANRIGLYITPRLLFENQTIAELAATVGTKGAVQAEQGLVMGPVPLTPIQHWFFEQNLPEPQHFNQSIMLQVPRSLEPSLIEQAFQHLSRHHDALRLRFANDGSGWKQFHARVDEIAILGHIDLSALSRMKQESELEAAATALQASLNLTEGPMLRVGLFDLGKNQASRLLIVIHHLIVDGVSWRILLEDLQNVYQQLERGQSVQLAPKTTSFKQWAERAVKYAQSKTLEQELDYWLAETQMQVSPLPIDYPRREGDNTSASTRTVLVELDADETRALLQDVPAAYRTEINDVLLTAVTQAFAHWTGENSVLIDLEAHGREEISESVDVSRTVGWFTALFPVLLTRPGSDGAKGALTFIKEQLRRIPNRGIGYGLLRYLNGKADLAQKLRDLPQAEISFNYLGQWDQAFGETSLFRIAPESGGADHSLQGERCHLLEINGLVADGKLWVRWIYSQRIHRQATIERLAQYFVDALRDLITHCQLVEPDSYLSSDFPDAELTEEKLDRILLELGLDSLED